MYSRKEASQIRQAFWTTFGQYMQPVSSAGGMKVNWVNYKTGEQHISFKMEADNKSASIAILLAHHDTGMQELYFEQFLELKNILHGTLEEEWQWSRLVKDEHGKTVSKIFTTLEGVSVFRKEDWTELISFFKPRIIALDAFWNDVKYVFETLK